MAESTSVQCRKRSLENDDEESGVKKQRSAQTDEINEHGETTDSELGFNINVLPQPLLLNILSNVPMNDLLRRVSFVCKYWRALANDPHLWRRLRLCGHLKLPDDVLLRLAKLSQNVLSIDLTDCRDISAGCLASVLRLSESLQRIKLTRCQTLPDEAFCALGNYCHKLQEAYLDNCYRLSDTGLHAIAQGCPMLRVVCINHCNVITDKGICAIAKGCPCLVELQTNDCKKLSDDCLDPLIEGCPNLEMLNLSACDFSVKGIQQIKKLKKLRSLDLAHMSELDNASLILLSRHCTKLATINVNLCTHITDEAIKCVAQNSQLLANLYVVACNITDKGLVYLGKHCRHLKHVDVGWCEAITETGARFLVESCATLDYLGLMRCDRIAVPASVQLEKDFPHTKFSTMYLDCQRLLVAAQAQGHLPPHIPIPLPQDLHLLPHP